MNTDEFEGHMMDEDYQVWCWSKEMLKKAEDVKQLNATAALLRAAPDLLADNKRLRFHLQQILDEIDPDDYENEMHEWFTKMKRMYGGEEE